MLRVFVPPAKAMVPPLLLATVRPVQALVQERFPPKLAVPPLRCFLVAPQRAETIGQPATYTGKLVTDSRHPGESKVGESKIRVNPRFFVSFSSPKRIMSLDNVSPGKNVPEKTQ